MLASSEIPFVLLLFALVLTRVPSDAQDILKVQDDVEDDAAMQSQFVQSFNGTLMDTWNVTVRRCCSAPVAPLVVDTHFHVWDEDPRPNRGQDQLGLLEDVVTEAWGVGVDLGVLVQPGFRGANNTYITRSLERFPGALAGEVEYIIDYSEETLEYYDELGVRGLRFKATSLQKYVSLVKPRLESIDFSRIAQFMKKHDWHYGVQLSKEAGSKWPEILKALQSTGVPIIIDMFGRPDPLKPAGTDIGTQAILAAAVKPPPAGKIWMELGGPFRVDPRCTYAEPWAADPLKCLPENRVQVPRPDEGVRSLCCPLTTHNLLIRLTALFMAAVGEEFVIWGTDWPFISDQGVTILGLLDAVATWVPDTPQRERVLGFNALRPQAVGNSPLFPLVGLHSFKEGFLASPVENAYHYGVKTFVNSGRRLSDSDLLSVLNVRDEAEDNSTIEFFNPFGGTLVDRWNVTDRRCCSAPAAPFVVDTHFHVWDEEPRPNRGRNQTGLLEDAITEGWGVGVHLGVLVQPGFRKDNNSYITRSLERLPGALSGEVEFIVDYPIETLEYYHSVGVRGLRFKATSLQKYEDLIKPRLISGNFSRIAQFMKTWDWHYGVQLSKEAGSKWFEILEALQVTQVPIVIDMFGRPDPLLPAGADNGTQAILRAAMKPPPAGKIWMELGGPFRVDPRCTYAEPAAADPLKCKPEDRVDVPRAEGGSRILCCPRDTHNLFIQLAGLFNAVVGPDFVLWGTDWPFITDQGVTINGLLDAMRAWVPNDVQRERILGLNAVRPQAVGKSPLFPFVENPEGVRRRRTAISDALIVADEAEDDPNFVFPHPFGGTLVDRWNVTERRCCSAPVAPLVIDTHAHVWDEDPRPNRGRNQLGLVEDVISEGWGVGVDLGVLVQPGFRLANNTYITRSLEAFPGSLSAEVEYVVDYSPETLDYYHTVGVRGLRFKATSLVKYESLVTPRLNSSNFSRIALFMKERDWHYGVQLSKEVSSKWPEILEALQITEVPIIIDMFGRPDPMLLAGTDLGTQAIIAAASKPPPAGKIWMELGGPFRVDPRCTYAEPAAADPLRCLPFDRVDVPQQGGGVRNLCCPRDTHILLIELAARFTAACGEEFIIWGTDWPFITDQGVTIHGLLDAMNAWVPDSAQRERVLGSNAVRPRAVGASPLFPFEGYYAQQSVQQAPMMSEISVLTILLLFLIFASLVAACCCERYRVKYGKVSLLQSSTEDTSSKGRSEPQIDVSATSPPESSMEKPPPAVQSRPEVGSGDFMPSKFGGVLERAARDLVNTRDLEPWHGLPPRRFQTPFQRPILGDVIAGGVKGIVELVASITFAALMTPDELQPFLPIFLNYALFGFIVSQITYIFTSRYTTPVRTTNISAAIFFLEVLAACRTNLQGLGNSMDVTVNTLLMAATIMTWLAGLFLWLVGTFKLVQFVRFLSAPVKLGTQGSIGYFLFATGVSIATGISWLNFTSLGEFSVYFNADILPKWILTLTCAFSIVYLLNRYKWPYTIPAFVFVGIVAYHGIAAGLGVSTETSKETGWLYPPPEGGDGNPFEFLVRIYNVQEISWFTIRRTMQIIGTAAIVTPFLSAVVNLVLFETAFSEEIGSSSLSYELRIEGLVHFILAAVGGYSTSPTAGGTAVHRKIGARSNWGLVTAVTIETGFLVIPGSTQVIQFVPKFVIGAVSLIVAISMLDSSLRGGFKTLGQKEYAVSLSMILISLSFGLENGIAAGWLLSFACYIQETGATAPLRLSADAGIVASHAIWGTRSARLVARLRGTIRIVCFQGYLFFAATQPALKDVAKKHLQEDACFFFIADFSAASGMDDSSPFEFKLITKAARAVGIPVVFCGGGDHIIPKLRRAGVFPDDETEDLTKQDDLLAVGKKAAVREHFCIYVIETADQAIEFCELALALRLVELSPEVLPAPSPNLLALGSLVRNEFSQFEVNLKRGELLHRNADETFILVAGAVATVVDLKTLNFQTLRPEVLMVYRCVPGIELDFCFGGNTPGHLCAMSDSKLLFLPKGALTVLEDSKRWPDLEAIWSQLAEFLAASMHPIAMKATIHDARGDFSSSAAQAFDAAVADFEKEHSRRPAKAEGSYPAGVGSGVLNDRRILMQNVLQGQSEKMEEMRRHITVNFAGQRPVFSSFIRNRFEDAGTVQDAELRSRAGTGQDAELRSRAHSTDTTRSKASSRSKRSRAASGWDMPYQEGKPELRSALSTQIGKSGPADSDDKDSDASSEKVLDIDVEIVENKTDAAAREAGTAAQLRSPTNKKYASTGRSFTPATREIASRHLKQGGEASGRPRSISEGGEPHKDASQGTQAVMIAKGSPDLKVTFKSANGADEQAPLMPTSNQQHQTAIPDKQKD